MKIKTIPSVIEETLTRGGVGVLPTDTLYGIVGQAFKKSSVERIYALRKRNLKKPMIVLIADVRDLASFGVKLDAKTKRYLQKMWPGKVSVILPAKKYRYLHRGTGAIAFRLPTPHWLRALLRKTGPLVAPSANHEGKPPARTVGEAKRYFNDGIDFYVDMGRLASRPSRLIRMDKGAIEVLRA